MNVADPPSGGFIMKLIGMTICAAALCVASLGADAGQTSTKSKVTVKDGKDVDVTGCVASASSGRGDGKVEIETKTKTKVEHGDDKETKSKSTMEGDLAGMPFLSVKSLKMIAA